MTTDALDPNACYAAVRGRDKRFDGVFYTGVTTTGIYCRPSCPARTPKPGNVRFFPTAAAAQAAGFRTCRRCRPDLTPGSPEWDVRADVAGRAMRLIADGVVERSGVEGLAARLGYTPRHLNRILGHELGAGPLALARAQRAHAARILIETTDMTFTDVAFAAGFQSVRQFNATIREAYACSPSRLRGARSTGSGHGSGVCEVRLAVREPFDPDALLDFLRPRLLPGVERLDGRTYSRTLRLPHGDGRVWLTPEAVGVRCRLELADLRDMQAAVERCRRLLDLDADPEAVLAGLGDDPQLGARVRARPGLRVPGHVDGFEVAVRAVCGQQVSVAGARTVVARLAREYGHPLASATDGEDVTLVFPAPEALAAADPGTLAMPAARGRALVGLAAAVADGRVVLDRSADRAEVRARLLELPGIGPWTAGYIALRALGDPDVFLPTDLGVKRGLAAIGVTGGADRAAQRWRPWRSYALMHLWTPQGEDHD